MNPVNENTDLENLLPRGTSDFAGPQMRNGLGIADADRLYPESARWIVTRTPAAMRHLGFGRGGWHHQNY